MASQPLIYANSLPFWSSKRIQFQAGEQFLGSFVPKTKIAHVKLSNGGRVRAALNADVKPVEIPHQWYNLIADLSVKPPPPLNPQTFEPIKPEDLSPLFADELIKQEVSSERFIDIPDEVLDIYRLWRPTPLIRAKRLEKLLGTPARIYYKYEGVSPAGSHKPNSAVPQVYYNAQQGIKKVVTETGAGQWGSSLAFACSLFGVDCGVWQVRASYDQKPYRRLMMQTWGAQVYPSPSNITEAGRKILKMDPSTPGSLGIAISEAVEVAATNADTKYCLGSVLNHVLLHQTVIGEECIKQMEAAGETPDIIIGCTGGGSNFAGLSFPFIREKLSGKINPVIRAVEATLLHVSIDWPRMRLILGTTTTTSSSIVAPPPHQAHHGRCIRPKAKPKPNPKSKYSITEHSPSNNTPPPPSTVHSSHAPLLSSVRLDFTSQHKYYADLASKLAEDGRFEEFVMIVESVVSSGSGSKFVSLLSFELVSRGIMRSLLEGRIHCVAEVFKKVEKLGVAPLKLFDGNSFHFLKKECEKMVECGEVEKFVDLIDTLAGCRFPIKELGDSSRVVKFCVDKRDTNLAVRYASMLPHAHILFCSIICEFGKQRDLISALTVYEASKKNLIGPNMYICRTIIDICGLCGDYMQSRNIYEELLSQKIALNIYVFNSVMNVNAHDLNFSLQVYKNMKEFGIVADMASYNILLKACCIAGRVELAQEIYREVKHLELKGVLKLDVFTYSTIVKVFADAKLWQMALEIKEDMLSAGVTPNTVTWSSLINACANAGLVEQALHLFDDMLLAGCEPNSQCCNILLQACVEACQYDRAFRLFYSWKQSLAQETFCEDCNGNSNLSTESKQNHFVSGTHSFVSKPHHLSFAKRFPFRPTTTTYNIMMKACGTDYYRAKALMDEMRTADLSPNHISWSILIDTCGGLGSVAVAVQILNSMREAGINPDVVAYTTAIKVCVKNKSFKLAFSLFTEMKQYQIQPNLVTYNTLLRARSRYGSLHEVQQCLAVYQDMRKAGFKSNDHYLKELIEEWCEGVIQHNNQSQKDLTLSKGTNLRPQSLLLEKVAEHLQKSTTDNLAVDLRGLTKIEARIVVLAVLRMIKENHSLGIPIKDDMLIILGPNKVGVNPAKNEDLEVKDAITELLQSDLGINVSLDRPTIALDKPLDSDPKSEEILGRLHMKFRSSPRRPAILQRLKVTKKSLQCWLQRRTGASTR